MELGRQSPWNCPIVLANGSSSIESRNHVGARQKREKGVAMAKRGIAVLIAGLLLGGCMQGTLEQASDANFTARDKKLLANAPYAKASIPLAYQRSIVQYHRKEAPGSIVV